jgi:hypothetical protein
MACVNGNFNQLWPAGLPKQGRQQIRLHKRIISLENVRTTCHVEKVPLPLGLGVAV